METNIALSADLKQIWMQLLPGTEFKCSMEDREDRNDT